MRVKAFLFLHFSTLTTTHTHIIAQHVMSCAVAFSPIQYYHWVLIYNTTCNGLLYFITWMYINILPESQPLAFPSESSDNDLMT